MASSDDRRAHVVQKQGSELRFEPCKKDGETIPVRSQNTLIIFKNSSDEAIEIWNMKTSASSDPMRLPDEDRRLVVPANGYGAFSWNHSPHWQNGNGEVEFGYDEHKALSVAVLRTF